MRKEVKEGISYFKGIYENTLITLTNDEYIIAMSHVEHMRQTAEEDNYYDERNDDDEEYLDIEGWCLSDTLSTAINEIPLDSIIDQDNQNKIEVRIKRGLKILKEDMTIIDPCGDANADDVQYDD